MIIAHYMPGLWDNGGINRYIGRLARAQQAAGHEVIHLDLSAVVPPTDRHKDTLYCDSEAAVANTAHRMGAQVLHVHRDFPSELGRIIPIVRSVHDHTPYCPSGGRYLRRSDQPCNRAYSLGGCLWGHAVDRCGSVRPGALIRSFATTRREMRRLAGITTLVASRFVEQQMLRQGYDAARLVRLPMPAPPVMDRVAPPPAAGSFVFLGRLVPHKGLAWLLRNVALMPESASLDIAGEGNEMQAMTNLAANLGLQNRVRFHGWLDSTSVERLIDNATALIVPSRWHEPFGLVSLEAMARGRAVIASNTGALPEVIVDGQSGLIVPVEDRDGLASAMHKLIASNGLAGEMGRAGWKLAGERYSMEAHLRGVMDAYAAAIQI